MVDFETEIWPQKPRLPPRICTIEKLYNGMHQSFKYTENNNNNNLMIYRDFLLDWIVKISFTLMNKKYHKVSLNY